METEIKKNFLYKKIIKNIFKFGLVLFVILITCDALYTYFFFKNDIKKMCIYTNEKNKEVIENKLDMYKNLINSMAQDRSFIDPELTLVEKTYKSLNYQRNFNVDFIGISDNRGALMNTLDKRVVDISKREYFKRAMLGKTQVISDLVYSKFSGVKSYVICTPFYNNDKIQGAITLSIRFDDIEHILKSYTETMYSAIISDNFEILTHSFNNSLIGENMFNINEIILWKSPNDLKYDFINGNRGSYYSFSTEKKILYFTSYDKIEGTNWRLFNIININEYLNLSIYTFLLKITAIIFFLVILTKILSKNLEKDTSSIDKFIWEASTLTEEQVSEKNLKKLLKYTTTAFEDPLTKTLRRDIFFNKVTKEFNSSDPEKISLVIFIDLDNLKPINDDLGHDIGDLTLINFTYKIKSYFNNYSYLLSRYGGDEFIVFVKDITEKELSNIEKTINRKLSGVVPNSNLNYSASIGVSIYPQSSQDLNTLIKLADIEVYKAKRSGKNCIKIYRKEQ